MGIEQLKKDVKNLCKYKITYHESGKIVYKEREGCIVHSKNEVERIVILQGLEPKRRIETEAHELCHLLLQYSGLVSIDASDIPFAKYNPFFAGDFSYRINNAISHFVILKILKQKYHINSESFLKTYHKTIDDIEKSLKEIVTNKYRDFIWGIELYDIARCLPSRKIEVQKAIKKYPLVKKTFKNANSKLSDIKIDMDINKQRQLVDSFLNELELDKYLKI